MRKKKGALEENIRKTYRSFYYYMRCWLIQHEKHSSYESRDETNPTCIQVMSYMR